MLLCWCCADFLTGVYHWSVDNYGSGATPLVGSQIAAFQGHHQKPWTITEREFCNNVHKVDTLGPAERRACWPHQQRFALVSGCLYLRGAAQRCSLLCCLHNALVSASVSCSARRHA